MKANADVAEENVEKRCDTKEHIDNNCILKMSGMKKEIIENHNEKIFAEIRHITEGQVKNMLQHRLSVKETAQIQTHLAQCTYCVGLFAKVMEQGYLVSPPSDMKAHILKKSKNIKKHREYSKKMQLFFYSLRVGVAMCFALILLFAIGNEQVGIEMNKTNIKTGFQLELLDNINQNINEVTTKIITMEGINHDTEKE